MRNQLIAAYELLAAVLPFAVTCAVLAGLYKRRGIKVPHSHYILLAVFAFYLYGVFHVTSAGRLSDLLYYGVEIRADQVNLTPFSRRIDSVDYILNMILFMPLGFLLPLIGPCKNHLPKILLWGFGFSLLIEVSQLFNNRASDVDDLIMNTIGALIGILCYRLFARVTKRLPEQTSLFKYEPFLYIAVPFLGRFFLFNDFALIKLLHGF